MGKKGAMPSFDSVDHYIQNQSEEAQVILTELRSIIKETVPGCIELPYKKVPSFTLVPGKKPETQLMISAYSKYVSFYPFQPTVDHFKKQLTGFELGKGTVKFPYGQPIPKELIVDMLTFRVHEILKD